MDKNNYLSGYEFDGNHYSGFKAFQQYFSYATSSRPKLILSGKSSVIKQIEAWDIRPASDINTDIGVILERASNDASLEELAQTSSHKPKIVLEAARELMKELVGANPKLVSVTPGSSMIAINFAIQTAVQSYLQSSFDAQRVLGSNVSIKQPAVIGCEGNFKCGGSFPYLHGAVLVYAKSSSAKDIRKALSEASERKLSPVALVWEEPSATGQISSKKDLAEVATLIEEIYEQNKKFITIVDAYNAGLHKIKKANSLYDFQKARKGMIYTTSVRKKLPAANLCMATPIVFGSEELKERIEIFYSNSFYCISPFANQLHERMAAESMLYLLKEGSKVDYQPQIFDYLQLCIKNLNTNLNIALAKPLIEKPEAGINYFIMFDKSRLEAWGCENDHHLVELLSLFTGIHCSVPSSMGISKDKGIGIRINAMRSGASLKSEGFCSNKDYLNEVFRRLQCFFNLLATGKLAVMEKAEISELETEQIVVIQNAFAQSLSSKPSNTSFEA